ncbi:hypothetical protein SYNPS1DRAFT_31700 [Syncephalis pseudoplumigaleata]|uniref:Uncharacterized protein n=1 Tax=Syncephalis pseudoplumigaleata TaxID=1712513 RepID=A0A4P9YUV7_9FUNG|nr:hypothetical protein SYNPS1DRAFT_31700 [Syncephalis pseudoplumigaleata]|eukprot:RKP22680.1 hypothetical protein SYNPS1DRAFT_31700 [Syncephalis pseudoplumigaleata]
MPTLHQHRLSRRQYYPYHYRHHYPYYPRYRYPHHHHRHHYPYYPRYRYPYYPRYRRSMVLMKDDDDASDETSNPTAMCPATATATEQQPANVQAADAVPEAEQPAATAEEEASSACPMNTAATMLQACMAANPLEAQKAPMQHIQQIQTIQAGVTGQSMMAAPSISEDAVSMATAPSAVASTSTASVQQ